MVILVEAIPKRIPVSLSEESKLAKAGQKQQDTKLAHVIVHAHSSDFRYWRL